MAVIDAEGLFNGERIRKCSDLSRLYWPYFYSYSNGFARMEINYEDFHDRVLRSFKEPLSKEVFMTILREYRDNYLLFLYRSGNQLWGQWLTDTARLPRHKTAKDLRSPEPPIEKFAEFQMQYELSKTMVPADLENFGDVPVIVVRNLETFPKVSENFQKVPRGVGVGGGVGEGVGKTTAPVDFSATDSVGMLFIRMKLSGEKMRSLARDAISLAMGELQCDGLKAADFIGNKWDEYQAATMDYKVGKSKFLEEGVFLKNHSAAKPIKWKAKGE